MKGHPRILQVIGEPAIGFDEHVLHDIADVQTALDAPIESHLHEAPQRLAMAIEQSVHGCRIATFDLFQQVLRVFLVGPHTKDYRSSPCAAARRRRLAETSREIC